MKKTLRHFIIGGILFTSVAGTLFHFVYEWTGENFFAGLIAPVSESVWEHIKLLFFPALFYHILFQCKIKDQYTGIESAGYIGLIVGCISIPVLFYIYTGILGKDILALDILTFLISIVISFFIEYRLALKHSLQSCTLVLRTMIVLLVLLFFIFTLYPPDIPMFISP